MPLDLGNLLQTAGEAWIQQQFQPAPQVVNYPTYQNADLSMPDLGIPFVDVIPEPGQRACGGASPVYKKVCGQYKWVYPKRRRRKQLLTNSDAAGLAKLKGLVGVGKTMDTWIATHS